MVKAAKGALLATLEVDRNSGAPIYRQIEDFLRQMILNGALPPSQKLPSTRELALELGVSRITIKSVYEQLISEGYVQGKIGAGTFVSEGLDGETPVVPSLGSVKKTILMEISLKPPSIFRFQKQVHGMGQSYLFVLVCLL